MNHGEDRIIGLKIEKKTWTAQAIAKNNLRKSMRSAGHTERPVLWITGMEEKEEFCAKKFFQKSWSDNFPNLDKNVPI